MLKTFEYTKIVGKENIEFGSSIIIDDFVFIYVTDKMKIGNYVHIAGFSTIVAGEPIYIGDFCAISHGCRLLTRSDDFKYWGFGNSTISEKYRNIKSGSISMDKFSIIGANSVVMPGVNIGEGVAVGASSIVTKDLLPWGIYIGNRRVGERDQKGIMQNYEKFMLESGQ